MKKMKRIVACLLALCTLFALVSCSRASEKAAVTYKDYSVSRAIVQYLCCLEKTSFLYEAYGLTSDQLSSGELQDNAQIWIATDADGVTVGDTLKMTVLEKIQLSLYFCQYAKEQGRELTEEQIKTVENEFASLVKRNFTDKKAFNKQMESYGINYDQMLEYKKIEALAYLCEEFLFGKDGPMRISDDNAKKYFNDKYLTLDCIFINTKNKTFPNGKTVILPEEEKTEKIALAGDLYNRLQNGEDFATLCLEYSDQNVSEELAKSGYTFEVGTFFSPEVEEAALEAEKGAICRVETEDGIYLFRRNSLDANAFDGKKEAILEMLKNVKKTSLLTEVADEFKMDEEFFDSIDVAELNHVV